MKLYESLAAEVEGQVARGVLLEGERLPSVRQASQRRRLSISTVLRAYSLLESKGVIESRPQSGFFVRAQLRIAARPAAPAPALTLSSEVDVSRLVLSTLRTIRTQGAAPLGSPYPDPAVFPAARISRAIRLRPCRSPAACSSAWTRGAP